MFDRAYEKTYGPLSPKDFPPIDWTSRSDIEALFPPYKRAQLARNSKDASFGNGVELDLDLKSPFGDKILFDNTKLKIEAAKRAAVFGINGSGKTCLFEAIATNELRDFPEHIHVHHMKEPEHNEQADALSVIDAVLCSHKFRRVLLPIEVKLRELLAEKPDADVREKLKANLAYVEQNLNGISSGTAVKRAQAMLRVLGFDETGELAPVSSLSGGLRMRVALASAFFIEPQLLLLDEPTNHLDLPSVLWLENRLRGYKGSFLLVTHDRRLLENVVTSVILIQDQKLEYFTCGFAAFEKRKEQMDKDRERMVDQFMRKNRNINPSSHVYPRYKGYLDWQTARIERRKLMADKFSFRKPPSLELTPGATCQDEVSLIKVKDLRFSYDPEAGLPYIFDNPVSYEVKMNTRVGIMGPNGAGKSTFLKLITGKLQPTSGSITINPQFKLAYFGQHSTKELKLDMCPKEFMEKSFPDANPGNLAIHLERTSINYDLAQTAMSNLSFSQRSCVIFAKLTFRSPHLLILDEPTNFLDLDSVDSLINATTKFTGGLIVVTHNRDFLSRCAQHFVSIIPGAFLEFGDMKTAERATYSFISALEEGRDIDVKKAIQQNRGGGAAHTDEEQAARRQMLDAQLAEAKALQDAEAVEKRLAEEKAAAREANRKAKVAAQRLDWAEGESVWVNAKGRWQQGTVTRNAPGVGVTVKLQDGTHAMVNASKVKETCPVGNNQKGRGGAKSGGRGRGGGASGGKSRGGGGGGSSASKGSGKGRGGSGGSGRGGAQQSGRGAGGKGKSSGRAGGRGGSGAGKSRAGGSQRKPRGTSG